MKIVLRIFAVLIMLLSSPAYGFTIKDLSVYVADKDGKSIPYPAPDGTRITILADGKQYTCAVQNRQCTFNVPTPTLWKILNISWTVGIGYVQETDARQFKTNALAVIEDSPDYKPSIDAARSILLLNRGNIINDLATVEGDELYREVIADSLINGLVGHFNHIAKTGDQNYISRRGGSVNSYISRTVDEVLTVLSQIK